MDIYMDVCCLNRPFDDQDQKRIREETEAITVILERCRDGEWRLVCSNMIDYELSGITDQEKLDEIRSFFPADARRVLTNDAVFELASRYRSDGIKKMDSFHLALAEFHRLDVFLTTDDALLAGAERIETVIQVANPCAWLKEVDHDNQR